LNNLLSAVTGQCVCQDGYYADKQGTCISLQTCLEVDLGASGRKKRDLLGGLLGGGAGGIPIVGDLLGGGVNGLPILPDCSTHYLMDYLVQLELMD
uniref:EB domain-containing protein n=1 Tax=Plectus sambesii TaxID=2011161 RepID=A0A914VU26_9BILA